jgi:hypothetical protein
MASRLAPSPPKGEETSTELWQPLIALLSVKVSKPLVEKYLYCRHLHRNLSLLPMLCQFC